MSTPGMAGVSSAACTEPAGRLDVGRRLHGVALHVRWFGAVDRTGCRLVLRAVGIGQGVEERERGPDGLGDVLGRGEVGERPAHVGLEPMAEPAEIAPQSADLPAILGSLSGPSTMRATTRMTSTFAGLRNTTTPECTGGIRWRPADRRGPALTRLPRRPAGCGPGPAP